MVELMGFGGICHKEKLHLLQELRGRMALI